MKERELRDLIADVKTGQLSRRAFVQQMIADQAFRRRWPG